MDQIIFKLSLRRLDRCQMSSNALQCNLLQLVALVFRCKKNRYVKVMSGLFAGMNFRFVSNERELAGSSSSIHQRVRKNKSIASDTVYTWTIEKYTHQLHIDCNFIKSFSSKYKIYIILSQWDLFLISFLSIDWQYFCTYFYFVIELPWPLLLPNFNAQRYSVEIKLQFNTGIVF